jgi:hypothetical protein
MMVLCHGVRGGRSSPPGKGGIDDHRQGGIRRVIAVITGYVRLRVAQAIAEELIGPSVACSEKSATFMPLPSHVTPSG